jgi:hypothetical protein
MVELKNQHEVIEKIEVRHFKPTKTRLEIVNRTTKAKTFRSWMEKSITLLNYDKNKENALIFEDILKKYNEFNPIFQEKNLKLEIEVLGGWKGVSDTRIYRGFDNNIRILIPQKDKLTGQIKKSPKEVLKEDINRMIKIIKNLELNKVYTCYEIVNMMGLDWKEDVWKNRTKVYFKMYYFPLKILEASKLIQYGDGTIKRIK